MGQNKLTVYSNGLTRVQRFITVAGKTTVTIPVRKSYLADVLATLGVYGKVKLVEPPSYDNGATANSLKLDPANVYFDIGTKLSGADVTFKAGSDTVTGKLCGVEKIETEYRNCESKTTTLQFVVLTASGIQYFNQQAIVGGIKFNADVERLIQNALVKNFSNVRPDSVLVKLVLEPSGVDKAEALLDYCTPTAAWQSVYKLRVGDKTTLEYNAKLDNPTDEDWLQSLVSVVVGEPISLDSYLAEVIVPQRTKIDLVSRKALGPVRATEGMKALRGMPPSNNISPSVRLQSVGKSTPMESFSDDEATGDVNYCATMAFAGGAETAEATAEEIGDFAVFNGTDVIDIRANLSGVVRLFTEEVESKEVLFFDYGQDKERAYRGVRLTNTTKSSLGNGICTLYLGDTFAGQAEFKAIKPGKSKTLVFSRENGVEVNCKPSGYKSSRIAVGVASGEFWWQDRLTSQTPYTFDNPTATAFEVEVNHVFGQKDPSFEITAMSTGMARESITTEATKTGLKLTFKLAAGEVITFSLNETKVVKSQWTLQTNLGHLINSLSSDEVVLSKFRATKGVAELEELLAKDTKLTQDIETFTDEAESLKEEQNRLLELVKAGSTASQLSKWQGNLDKTEDRITEIEKKIVPAAQKEVKLLNQNIAKAMKTLAFSWAAGDPFALFWSRV